MDVRFTPESRHAAAREECPLSTKSGHLGLGETDHRIGCRGVDLYQFHSSSRPLCLILVQPGSIRSPSR